MSCPSLTPLYQIRRHRPTRSAFYSDVDGMRAAAEALKSVVAGEGIDLLFQCQNGPPTGEFHLNKDG